MPRKFVIHGVGKEESATSQLGSESGLSGGAWVALSLLVGRCPGRRAHLSNPSYLPYSLPFSHSLQLISRLFQNLVRMSTIRRIKRTIPDSDDEDLEPLTLPPAEASTKRESKIQKMRLLDPVLPQNHIQRMILDFCQFLEDLSLKKLRQQIQVVGHKSLRHCACC
jgi:hypothetical protein